jgi:hypothetical protein
VDILAYPQGEAPYRITDVYLLDPTTGSERRLVTSGGKEYPHVTDLVWSPSGRWVAVTLWWAEGGYLREAHRILDSASGELVQEFDFDTEDVTEPLVDWGP